MSGDGGRWFDLVAATLGWFWIGPLVAMLSVLIKLDSPGPAFFAQQRIGRDGRPFTMYKFRTMRQDSGPPNGVAPDYSDVDFDRFVFTPDRPDPRVTALGRVLRRTSLDELPQLINVIRGDMAIVGPRPEIPQLVRQYPPDFHRRHRVRPGITGLAQIRGRSNLTYVQTIRYDLAYIRRRSPRLDVAILGRTLGVVLRGTGAR